MTAIGASLIYVDLIEAQPLDVADWLQHMDGVDEEGDFFKDDAAIDAAYRKYIDAFQPWRIAVVSGGNHEPLFRSTERYFNEADARHAIDIAFGPNANVWIRQQGKANQPLRMALG